MPTEKKQNKQNKPKTETVELDDILNIGEGDVFEEQTSEGLVEEAKPEVKEPIVPQFSEEDIKKYFKTNPQEVKDLLGIKEGEKLPQEDSLTKLTNVLTNLIQNREEAPKRASNELQSILAKATKQSQLNLNKYQKVFKDEQRKGQTGSLLIYKSYGKNLPTRSLKVNGPEGTKVKKTLFEIGFLGVLLSFELGKEYTNVPNSIISFINRKVAAYQDVVKGKSGEKYAKAAFDISKNAA